ncbi:hypothetical protein [Acidovorax sp.]|uniref:hypothetical protein n=1 Tax=Acidovorax sp. TaxID=1872122 RepID=UPI00391FBF5E
MLKLDPQNFENFSEEDLLRLLGAGGWESILPRNLNDAQLTCLSDQLRRMLSTDRPRGPDGRVNAAVAMAILLVARAHRSELAEQGSLQLEGDFETLRDVMIVLSMAADREIVSRVLDRPGDDDAFSLFDSIDEIAASRVTA